MSAYDYDDARSETASRYYEDRRQRDARHGDSREYTKTQVTSRDLVPRTREDSDLSVEEIHREFPVPTYTRGAYRDYDDDRRSRSNNNRDYDRDYDRRETKKTSRGTTFYGEERKRRRMISNQEKILAAIVGGAIAVGGKELYDRREARQDRHEVQRNPLSSAALGAAGALAAYQGADYYNKHSAKEERKTLVVHKGRDSRGDLYSEDDSDLDDPSQKKSSKSFLESVIAATGMGAAAKAVTGGDDRRSESGRSRRGSRDRDGSRSQSRGGGGGTTNKIQKAAMASLIAGATEAFRVAKEPGAWKGEKAKRVLTAAAGAATIDAATDEKHSKMGLAESVIGGLLGNHIVNGSRRNIEEDRHTGRSRSRSRARSNSTGGGGGGGVTGLAALATAGLAGLGAKKFADSHERSRSRRRHSDDDDYDDRSRSRSRSHRSRSRSVVDSARRGLSKLGLGNDDDEDDRRSSSRRRHHRRHDSTDSRDYRDRDRDRSRDRSRDRDRDQDRGSGRGGRDNYEDGTRSAHARRKKGGSRSDSESDLGSSSGDEKRAKKIRGKQVITTGLAAVATIHAAHNVYQSMEKREARKKAVREGRLSEQEAKKLKNRALLQEAASVGIAALGIKGAVSELKEAREVHQEFKKWQEEKERRHQRRLQRLQSHSASPGRRRSENWSSPLPARADRADGPGYAEDDSYGALPAPPIAYDSSQYDRDY